MRMIKAPKPNLVKRGDLTGRKKGGRKGQQKGTPGTAPWIFVTAVLTIMVPALFPLWFVVALAGWALTHR